VNASRQFTALLQYSPASAAAAVTIQINGYRAPGSYMNTADASPVDVEVSPPGASQTGLSGFGAPGATVSIDPGATSGSVASPLLVDGRAVGAIHGRWRCA